MSDILLHVHHKHGAQSNRVCQELSFPPQVTFRCGLYTFEYEWIVGLPSIFNVLGLEVALLLDIGHFTHSRKPTILPWQQLRDIFALRERSQGLGLTQWQKLIGSMYDWARGHTKLDYFLSCLNRLRAMDAKDARDRVFASLGYLNRGSGSLNTALIPVDYEASVQSVYLGTSVMLLKRMSHLGLLSAIEDKSKRRTSGLPSWVPDFTVDHHSILGTYATYDAHPYQAAISHWQMPLWGPYCKGAEGQALSTRHDARQGFITCWFGTARECKTR